MSLPRLFRIIITKFNNIGYKHTKLLEYITFRNKIRSNKIWQSIRTATTKIGQICLQMNLWLED